MAKKQHYMTGDERQKLETLYNDLKLPVAKIAKILGFCRQTIYNELKLGSYQHTCDYYDETRYSADKAEMLHQQAQQSKGRPEKIGNDFAYAEFLEHKIMDEKFSPAAALAEARTKGFSMTICVTTLYSYIEKGLFLRLTNKHLWEKSKKKKKKETAKRIAHPKLPSIIDRPDIINQRVEYGHWEMDLVVSKKGSTTVLLTLTERKTKEELIIRLPNRKAETIRKAFDRLERIMPNFKEKFKTITTDNGSEFLEYEKLKTSIHGGERFEVYYCHSFAAWEKGINENQNRMIRRWYPKGTDFAKVKVKEIQKLQDWLNHYPRKSLGWKTPLTVEHRGSLC